MNNYNKTKTITKIQKKEKKNVIYFSYFYKLLLGNRKELFRLLVGILLVEKIV